MRRLALLILISGCESTTFTALSPPPPGRSGTLDSGSSSITLSRGVVLAFDCTTSQNDYDGPCRHATATTIDPAVAVVYPAALDHLVTTFEDREGGAVPATAFIVVGRAPGVTVLEFDSSDGAETFHVEVR